VTIRKILDLVYYIIIKSLASACSQILMFPGMVSTTV